MKLRLPHLLFIALVATMVSAPAEAAVMHSDVSRNTYVDFATNSGRFAVGSTSAMLDYIRKRDGGVKLSYTDSAAKDSSTLEHGMISFDAVSDIGSSTAIGYNYVVTVAHQQSAPMPTFTSNDWGIGEKRSIKYRGIQEGTQFIHQLFGGSDDSEKDYKINRLSKLVTDVETATVYSGDITENCVGNNTLVYRVGGGTQSVWDASGTETTVNGAGLYTVGGIGYVSSVKDVSDNDDVFQRVYLTTAGGKAAGQGATDNTPLPFGTMGGDSGSPYFVWDSESESFQFLAAHIGTNGDTYKRAGTAQEWTAEVMEADNVRVNMGRTDGTLRFSGAESGEKDGKVDGIEDTFSVGGTDVKVTVPAAVGYLRNSENFNIYDDAWNTATFNGVDVDAWGYTWKSLSSLKDSDTWYGYGDEYLNATASAYYDNSGDDEKKEPVIATGVTYAKLYRTQNVVLEAAADKANYIVQVDEDTDLGIGYLHFAANGHKEVQFNVQSAENRLLNSAGYVVDEDVQVNVSLRNTDASYMREWRKVGDGTLNICGEGKNEIFLNVGGKGETLLNQKEGYAAYNVLANTGSTVRIKDTSQIYRDFTFGNGGATLDMNGNSMDWFLTKGEDHGGFTINALTEEAIISNSSATKAVLTFREENNQKFVGSFQDSATSALGIVYDGKGTWELNSIRTNLENKDSGLTVMSGTVRLAGTLTVHGFGSYSASPDTADFSTREDDWHYADAAMNVTVADGATFELAGHARLTGDVSVQSKGKYIMREGVNHAEEYIEGGENKESTGGEVAKYYGHWGDVKLAEDSEMLVAYTADTDTATRYTGKVSGPGKLTVDLGTDAAAFVLDGEVSGVKSVDVVDKSKLELGSNVTIAALQLGNASFTKVHTMNEDVLSGSEEEQLSMKNTHMVVTADKTYTISHAKVEGSYIDAKEGSTLKLSDVYVAAGTYLTDAPATLVADDTTLQVVVGTNATAQPLTLSGALTVEAPGGADKATVAATDKGLQITSSIMDTFTVTGSLLTIDLTGSEWSFDGTALTLNGVAVGDWIALSFDTDDKSAASFDKDLAVKLTFSGVEALADVSLTGYYNVEEAAPTTVYFQTRYVPEPSTATLSLLALAALCARRRRRMA